MKTVVFLLPLCLVCALLLSSCAGKRAPEASTEASTEVSTEAPAVYEAVETGIESVNKYGNIILKVKPDEMQALGYEPADIVLVQIGTASMEMPVGVAYSDVDSGEPVCRYKYDDEDGDQVVLAVNAGNLAAEMGMAEIRRIEEDPGFECVWAEGFGPDTPVRVTMAQKQGFAEEYAMHRLGAVRTNDRADYADLTDEAYANFRAVATPGMGSGALCRSSTPVDPDLNRNQEADAALAAHGVRAIVNMANSEEVMRAFPGYADTEYAKCETAALNMEMDFFSDAFKEKLANGFRFIASHEGPYLIHCKEGKDRTGFACAVLECLMGASLADVTADYMLTYYNFYGVTPEDAQYAAIAESNIVTSLAKAFGTSPAALAEADLKQCAADYLQGIGLSAEELAALEANLAKDYEEEKTEVH